MGKTADNEIVKLEANFLNNMGIGFFIGGVFVPVLTAYPKVSEWFGSLGAGHPMEVPWTTLVGAVAAVCVSIWAGLTCHKYALKIAAQIQD